jgi:hypothetical protein
MKVPAIGHLASEGKKLAMWTLPATIGKAFLLFHLLKNVPDSTKSYTNPKISYLNKFAAFLNRILAAGWLVFPALPDSYKSFGLGAQHSSLAASASSQSYKYEWSEIDTMPTQK